MIDSSTTETNALIRPSNFSLTEEFNFVDDENLEELSLVWLDANVNKTNDCLEMSDTLRSIINYLKTFDNIEECINYINSITTETKIIFFVMINKNISVGQMNIVYQKFKVFLLKKIYFIRN